MTLRRLGPLALLLALLCLCPCAHALELGGKSYTPYKANEITVKASQAGTVTIEANCGDLRLKPAAVEVPVAAGTNVLRWDALTWGGEPLPRGRLTLTAYFSGKDGREEQARIEAMVTKPRSAVESCLAAASEFCADGKNSLRVEITLSAPGSAKIWITPADSPEDTIWKGGGETKDNNPIKFIWNGRDQRKQLVQPGRYTVWAASTLSPDYVGSSTFTVTDTPKSGALFVTGALLPEDLSDDAAVWAALTAPVVVGAGEEGNGLRVLAAKDRNAEVIGTCSCRTVGVTVLSLDGDGWARVGIWRQQDGAYTEGYVAEKNLEVVWPNTRYGAVIDKQAQTMTFYEDGRKLGSILVSTGLVRKNFPKAETRSGVYLIGTRLPFSFEDEGFHYTYPLRIDGGNLIHSVGFRIHDNLRDYSEELPLLGTPASHGCVRMDMRATSDESLSAWCVWTHLGRDTKLLVSDDAAEMAQRRREAGLE